MTNLEPKGSAAEWSREETMKFLESFDLVYEILMDEDPDQERPDVYMVTWEELLTADLELPHLQMAYNEIYSRYMHALEELYPQLKQVTTGEELMAELGGIPDLPPCDGMFTISNYESDAGINRAMSSSVAYLGEHGMALSTCVMTNEDGLVKSYFIGKRLDGVIWGGTGVGYEDDEQDIEDILEQVHPTQRNSLRRILHGNVKEYELDGKLTEVRIMTEDRKNEAELDELMRKIQAQYEASVKKNESEDAMGMFDFTLTDVHELHDIVTERVQQLDA